MSTQVIGSGPVGFTNSTGSQVFIPLSKLYFDDAGQIQADNKWDVYTKNKKTVDVLLKELVESGFLLPRTEAPIPIKPAILIEAAISGAVGNHIQVAFSNIVVDSTTPANSTFDCTITAKDTYAGLTLDSIKTVLGTKTPTLSLVNVKDVKSSLPTEASYVLTGGGAAKASKEIINPSNPSGTAFTLEAWKEGSDGNNITATIAQVDATAKTFTVIVEWKQPIITGIKVADLPKKLEGDGLVLKVSKPKDAEFAIPMAGTIIFNGGEDAKAATKASAIVIAQS